MSLSPCIIFSGCIDKRGYGRQKIGGVSDRAHRHAYRKHKGPIPKGFIVRHKCDNPPCINPDHLELGTQVDNMRDMIERDRSPDRARSNNGRAVVSEDIVRSIKSELSEPYWGQVRDMARKYGVSESIITNIKTGRTWI